LQPQNAAEVALLSALHLARKKMVFVAADYLGLAACKSPRPRLAEYHQQYNRLTGHSTQWPV
jgi:hypothetical protein